MAVAKRPVDFGRVFEAFQAAERAADWDAVADLGEQLVAAQHEEPRPEWRGFAAAVTATAHRHLGHRARAQELALEAVDTANAGTIARAYSLAEAVACHGMRGAFTALRECAQTFLQEFSAYPPEARAWAAEVYTWLIWAHEHSYDRPVALQLCREAAGCLLLTAPKQAAFQRVHAAHILLALGEVDAARAELTGITEDSLPPERLADLLYIRARLALEEHRDGEALTLALHGRG